MARRPRSLQRTVMARQAADERPVLSEGDGDHERFAHIVVPAHVVTEAYITGSAVTALCGKTWVPTRDPERYPVCPTCVEVLAHARGDQ